MFKLPYEPIKHDFLNDIVKRYMDNFKAIETKLNELGNKEEPKMFISREKWDELNHEVFALKCEVSKNEAEKTDLGNKFKEIERTSSEHSVQIYSLKCEVPAIFDILKEQVEVNYKQIKINHVIELILDHLNLEIKEAPSKVELVPKVNLNIKTRPERVEIVPKDNA